ncbi:helix-turn-helix domain-containing protein [Gordonia desulfuricans]|nr:helix-turn-helix transcriptional regulator [Gordonia desulfuricans]
MVAREYAGLTQDQLSDALGVSMATVQRAESGKTSPRRPTIIAWAFATGVNLAWLETGKTPAGPDGPDGGNECARRDSNPKPSDP